MAGQTITPSTSQQTVSCSGKKMTGNIVIGAIPSNYISTTAGASFFESGSYGRLAPDGAYLYRDVGRPSVGTKLTTPAAVESALNSAVGIHMTATSSIGTVLWCVFRRSQNLHRFSKMKISYVLGKVLQGTRYPWFSIYYVTQSNTLTQLYTKTNTSKTDFVRETTTVDISGKGIPNEPVYLMLYFSNSSTSSGAGHCVFTAIQMLI